MASVVFRIQGSDGVYRAYTIDVDAAVANAVQSFDNAVSYMPKALAAPMDTMLFALRHGPLQAIFKSKGYNPKAFDNVSKNSQTIGHLVQLYFIMIMEKSVDKDGNLSIIDMPQGAIASAIGSIISRSPELDRQDNELLEPVAAE